MLSQAVGYAATALGYIAAAGGKSVAVKDVAKACQIPGPYLAKIIHSLSRTGLVTTQRGIGGGVVLAREPRLVSLYDICVALDDPIIQNRCMLGVAECCDERSCPTHKFWKVHRAREVDFLQQTSIADIAAFETRRRWGGAPLTIGQQPIDELKVRRAADT
jgi:Rrf2 family iron-sulfur cluster assembly transcriptional regulator